MNNKYTVQGNTFNTFAAVVLWVWNTYKIDWEGGDYDLMSTEGKLAACKEIEDHLSVLNQELVSDYSDMLMEE